MLLAFYQYVVAPNNWKKRKAEEVKKCLSTDLHLLYQCPSIVGYVLLQNQRGENQL